MSLERKTRKKRRSKKAKQVQKRPPKRVGFPTDEQSIVLRRESAEKEKAQVTRVAMRDDFHGLFEVSSTQWEQPYRVEIRSLSENLNSCSCQDYRMNRLGCCKHIERVRQFIQHRKKRAFARAAKAGSPAYEIFMDVRGPNPRLRLLRPAAGIAAVERRVGSLFGDEGFALAGNTDACTAAERATAMLTASARKGVRLSEHVDYWLERERFRTDLDELRRHFDRDVAAAKRTDNPVVLPLYPYQKAGMAHLAFTGRALLADEMGLGKTVQAIAAAELLRQSGRVRRVLVVSPASLKAEWEDQIMQFTGRQAKPVFGSRPARLRLYAEEHPYSLCNYEQVRNDVDDINRLLVPDLVILDEAQRIKNWPTKTAKTIKRVRSPYAFVLTGTPLENRIEELYSLVEFVDPHVFGSLFRFQRAFMELTSDNEVRPRNLDKLHRTVSSVMLRRRKSDVEDALPERTDKNFFVSMTKEQRARYAEIEYDVAMLVSIMKRRPLTKKEQERLLLLLGCMRMICDTPYILDPECRDCPKLEELENILDDLLGDDPEAKVIIFSEWVRMLDLVKELLTAKGIGFAEHTGRIPQQKRREQIRMFKQNADCRVFLSSESGGAGLNLQAANIVINLDLPWNPAKLEQRIARAWRKHQKRSVRVVNLVAERSIESAMLDKLAYKTALADSVLDGAAFEERPSGKTGRQAFAARVGELLGGEPVAPAPPAREEKPRTLKEELTARHADIILGIERNAKTGGTVVVSRPGTDLDALRDTAEAAGATAEVITPEMHAMLLRLQEMGILTLSADIDTVHAADGYTPLPPRERPKPKLHRAAARKVWATTAAERKAVEALAGVGLAEQALPHLATVLGAGREAVVVLHHGPGTKPDGDGSELPTEPAALVSALAAFDGGGSDGDGALQEGLDLVARVEAELARP